LANLAPFTVTIQLSNQLFDMRLLLLTLAIATHSLFCPILMGQGMDKSHLPNSTGSTDVHTVSFRDHYAQIRQLNIQQAGKDQIQAALDNQSIDAELQSGLVTDLSLYPNPATEATRLNYTLQQGQTVKVAIYSLLGQQVSLIHQGHQSSGTYSLRVPISGLPAGVYFCNLQVAGHTFTQRMVVK
jgi:hypothetical protein